MRLALYAAAVALSGCAFDDPLTRQGLWVPNGANQANLRAMAADPRDLVTGQSDSRADGAVVTAAINRYRTGQVKDLPDSAIAKVAPIAINNNAPAASAPASN